MHSTVIIDDNNNVFINLTVAEKLDLNCSQDIK